MGYGLYSHAAHVALTTGRSQAKNAAELFKQRTCHPLLSPHGVEFRECRDSDEHPNSLGVIFALDVSGSMGRIPERMATHTLPGFMQALLDARVAHPQVMFMAVGHAGGDTAPLQVGQFESTERLIDRWLTSLYLEGGGGGGRESYELALYFAARHVRMDSVELRGRRGFLFITGDEPPNPAVSRRQVGEVIGDELAADLPIRDVIDEVQRGFEPFFLIPDTHTARTIERAWRDLLGDRVVVMEDADDTCYVAAGLVSLLEGSAGSLSDLVRRLSHTGMERERAARIARSLTPFAASIGRDDAPRTELGPSVLPTGDRPSGLSR